MSDLVDFDGVDLGNGGAEGPGDLRGVMARARPLAGRRAAEAREEAQRVDPPDLRCLGRDYRPADRRRTRPTPRGSGQEEERCDLPRTKAGTTSPPPRTFFRDCQERKWFPAPLRYRPGAGDPAHHPGAHRPKPRVIAGRPSTRLLCWAGASIEADDLPANASGPCYPIENSASAPSR